MDYRSGESDGEAAALQDVRFSVVLARFGEVEWPPRS